LTRSLSFYSLKLRNVLDILDQSNNNHDDGGADDLVDSTGKTLKVKVDIGHGTFMDAQV
jgi:hypothetical protein